MVASYAEAEDDFAAGRAWALPGGPDVVANFVNGDFEDLYAQFSPGLQAEVAPEDLAGFAYYLQHDRVHFEVPSSIGTFDGYLEGDVIWGISPRSSPSPFGSGAPPHWTREARSQACGKASSTTPLASSTMRHLTLS